MAVRLPRATVEHRGKTGAFGVGHGLVLLLARRHQELNWRDGLILLAGYPLFVLFVLLH